MFDIEMLPNVCYVSFKTSVRGIKITKYLRFDRTWRQITNHEWFIPKLMQNGAKERIWHRNTNHEYHEWLIPKLMTKKEIVEYVENMENVLGLKLLDYQKIFLRKAYEEKENGRNES